MDGEICKGCAASARISSASIDKAVKSFRAANPGICVEDALYERRLQKCLRCSFLEFGSTCRYCGCMVHLMALLPGKCCPRPKQPMW